MPKFHLPVQWMETGVIEVDAPTLEEAVAKAYRESKLPEEGDYLEDSFRVENGNEGGEVYPEDDLSALQEYHEEISSLKKGEFS